jgi:hypothetical protein
MIWANTVGPIGALKSWCCYISLYHFPCTATAKERDLKSDYQTATETNFSPIGGDNRRQEVLRAATWLILNWNQVGQTYLLSDLWQGTLYAAKGMLALACSAGDAIGNKHDRYKPVLKDP